jgi:hypothetical protein
MLPRAREEGLLLQELDGELLVYNQQTNRASCLNPTAALVFRLCDGKTTVAQMAARLQAELDLPADEAVVWLALERLGKVGLLGERPARPEGARLTRRELAGRLGLVGSLALLLPAVTSIVAPTPAQAATCATAGNACDSVNGPACCAGLTCTSFGPEGSFCV